MPQEIKEQLRKEIEEGRQKVAERREERGLEGVDPPEPFVSPENTVALIERCAGLEKVAKQYLRLCDEANMAIELSDKQYAYVNGFTDYTSLIRLSENRSLAPYGVASQIMIGLIASESDTADGLRGNTDRFIRTLFNAIQLANQVKDGRDYNEIGASELDDDGVAEYMQHYNNIKYAL